MSTTMALAIAIPLSMAVAENVAAWVKTVSAVEQRATMVAVKQRVVMSATAMAKAMASKGDGTAGANVEWRWQRRQMQAKTTEWAKARTTYN